MSGAKIIGSLCDTLVSFDHLSRGQVLVLSTDIATY